MTHHLTSKYGSAGDSDGSTADCSKVYVHGIYNGFEIERDLDVQDLLTALIQQHAT